jgi:hypothetical protein
MGTQMLKKVLLTLAFIWFLSPMLVLGPDGSFVFPGGVVMYSAPTRAQCEQDRRDFIAEFRDQYPAEVRHSDGITRPFPERAMVQPCQRAHDDGE